MHMIMAENTRYISEAFFLRTMTRFSCTLPRLPSLHFLFGQKTLWRLEMVSGAERREMGDGDLMIKCDYSHDH